MIPISKPDVGARELAQLCEAFSSNWLALGPKVQEFESRIADRYGYDHVVATNSGTAALDLAVESLDLDGTEILTPPGGVGTNTLNLWLLFVAGIGFAGIGLFLFVMVANARLSDKFRAEEFRNRLRAVGLEDDERPDFLDELEGDLPERLREADEARGDSPQSANTDADEDSDPSAS
jgi:hypothetical protein